MMCYYLNVHFQGQRANVHRHNLKFQTVGGNEHVCTACTEMCSEE